MWQRSFIPWCANWFFLMVAGRISRPALFNQTKPHLWLAGLGKAHVFRPHRGQYGLSPCLRAPTPAPILQLTNVFRLCLLKPGNYKFGMDSCRNKPGVFGQWLLWLEGKIGTSLGRGKQVASPPPVETKLSKPGAIPHQLFPTT